MEWCLDQYFADGLTEELLNILARIQELQVAGRTSSFAFKGQNEDLRGIAVDRAGRLWMAFLGGVVAIGLGFRR